VLVPKILTALKDYNREQFVEAMTV